MQALYEKYSDLISDQYTLDYYDSDQLSINIIRDPCRGLDDGECDSFANLGDYDTISAGLDFRIGFITSATILHCNQDWERLIGCGTYIEIHRPFDTTILNSIKIDEYYSENYIYKFFTTKNLCAGKYEICKKQSWNCPLIFPSLLCGLSQL
ncbi:hypothetical protein PPERSA_02695 [Pseudocohnilembus persalinus]|uniref:Uncharacterized protein n=1 Tax=Pseudocohnilembus persalinus TaxID=266149 RepID=A0A0V0R5P8_PSEPJ|nr:hypothetical protein PPERSA_02695 [Pseudocohnilembus persalinus]|eukprot:KRX09823.1 hypothetical protein PPERSA_02695 [Pseudocohnilembus persalinus]